jgi:hypothetical protein
MNSAQRLVQLTQDIFSFLMKRILNTLLIGLILLNVSLETRGQKPTLYSVKRMPFNSDFFSEISPVIVKDGILYCSDKRFSWYKDRIAFDGRRLYNIYLAHKNDSSFDGKPVELKSPRSTLFNNGPLCFAPDGKTVYFTSEVETGTDARKRKYKNHSGIFIAQLSGTKLDSLRPFRYNDPQYEVGQPSISFDGKYLFFASDMPGGQGGSDIYFCELIDGEWAAPVNLGPEVNSAGVENNPYIHPSGRLYFTSDRPGGVGKMDVYFTSINYGAWENPVLLPEPINSTSDDFAFVAEDNLRTGYFASNRLRTDDIYEFSFTIKRKETCDTIEENSYCYRFIENNAAKNDSVPFLYEWRFGDGTGAEGPVVEHCYSGPGTYIIQLDIINLVTNEITYNQKNDTLVITDIEQPYITAPDSVNAGQRIMLDADKTNLPGWEIAQYYWNFGDETNAIGKEVDKTFIKPGKFNIQLIISAEPEQDGTVREVCVSKNIFVVP